MLRIYFRLSSESAIHPKGAVKNGDSPTRVEDLSFADWKTGRGREWGKIFAHLCR